MSDELQELLAANAAFYAAFEETSLERMRSVWLDDDEASCVHPGWRELHGLSHIMRSWAVIFANTPYIQFVLTDEAGVIEGDLAVVTCAENILTSMGDLSGGNTVLATNVFRRTPDGWRLWRHHGSPVAMVRDVDEPEVES